MITVRVKNIPSMALLISFSLYSLGVINFQFWVSLFGTLYSWIYLRFFKFQDGVIGNIKKKIFYLLNVILR